MQYKDSWEVIDTGNEDRKFDSPLWRNDTCQYQVFLHRFYAESLDKALEKIAGIIELQRLEKFFQRDYTKDRVGLYWDTPRDLQDCQEVYICVEFAESLHAQDKGDIRNIRKNFDPDDPKKVFPDCLAEMDGKKIGIEVTQLREDLAPRNGYIQYKEWTLEDFQEQVFKLVRDKSKKAKIEGREELLESLHKLYVVIPTDEFTLSPETIRNYLKQPLGPKPDNIDEVYMLGPYEPYNNAVIRGREYEPEAEREKFIAFQVLWTEKDG